MKCKNYYLWIRFLDNRNYELEIIRENFYRIEIHFFKFHLCIDVPKISFIVFKDTDKKKLSFDN